VDRANRANIDLTDAMKRCFYELRELGDEITGWGAFGPLRTATVLAGAYEMAGAS
jgi:hypothetical protein